MQKPLTTHYAERFHTVGNTHFYIGTGDVTIDSYNVWVEQNHKIYHIVKAVPALHAIATMLDWLHKEIVLVSNAGKVILLTA